MLNATTDIYIPYATVRPQREHRQRAVTLWGLDQSLQAL